MKWTKETKVYMWANYYSEDGNWKAWDEEKVIKGGSRKKYYNTELRKMVNEDAFKHYWKLQNLRTGEVLENQFKTLKEAKTFAEAH